MPKGGLRRTHNIEDTRKKIIAAEECQGVATLPLLPDVSGDAQAFPLETAGAVGDDPMLQLVDLGDTGEARVTKRKSMRREKVRSVGHAQSLEMLERLGEPQLRTVRAFRSGKNILWVHEEDVAWLCTYLGAELGTGRVGPIEDADGISEHDCPENSPQKPIKRRQGVLGLQWSRGGRRHAWTA
jgi:hypothetical protein